MNTSILTVEISGQRGGGKSTLAQDMVDALCSSYNIEVHDEERVASRTPFVAGRPGILITVKGSP